MTLWWSRTARRIYILILAVSFFGGMAVKFYVDNAVHSEAVRQPDVLHVYPYLIREELFFATSLQQVMGELAVVAIGMSSVLGGILSYFLIRHSKTAPGVPIF